MVIYYSFMHYIISAITFNSGIMCLRIVQSTVAVVDLFCNMANIQKSHYITFFCLVIQYLEPARSVHRLECRWNLVKVPEVWPGRSSCFKSFYGTHLIQISPITCTRILCRVEFYFKNKSWYMVHIFI